MDKVSNNRKVVTKYLNDWIAYHPSEQTGVPLQIIEGNDGHLLLVEFGHGKNGWEYGVFVHFLIGATGNVTLLENNTDQEVFRELKEAGIDEKDLVIGWYPPELQEHSGTRAA
ncbi:element excision factor XisI family protein [Lewinella sp. 4G2]|uniref:element excision factor XisI family protein n=1 Tax=Lewinella sp. 4G2 TaxID=1803372 RepID=UPI0007B4C08A|nr:element excision factor XisI family protein [Lewinella sp. 4G2]OAV42666.1 hypothetical protein A3850_015600 [Lewinella sp. 4G2]